MAVGCCVSLLFGALPLVEVSCRTRDFKTLNMVASMEVTFTVTGLPAQLSMSSSMLLKVLESRLVNFTARSAVIALTRFALQQQQSMCRMTCASAL